MYGIKEIASLINGEIVGNSEISFTRLAPFFAASEKELTFAADEKMLKNIAFLLIRIFLLRILLI